jgi:hypothetical protein
LREHARLARHVDAIFVEKAMCCGLASDSAPIAARKGRHLFARAERTPEDRKTAW